MLKTGLFKNELGLIRFFGLFSGIMFPVFGFIHVLNGDESDSLILRLILSVLCLTLVSLTFLFDYFRKNYLLPVYAMSFLCILWFSYTMYTQDYTIGYALGSFILISAPALLMKTVKILLSFLIYSIVMVSGFAFVHPAPIFSPVILMLSMFSFSLMIFLFRRSSIRLQQKLRVQALILEERTGRIEVQRSKLAEINEMINDKNQAITDSLEYAESIQKAMLPNTDVFKERFKSYFVLYQPRDIVSGDFYWSHETSDKMIWAVADCTGHGVPGAFMSLISMSLMQEIVLTNKDNLSPSLILNELRVKIIKSLTKDKDNERHDGLDISLCMMDKKTKELTFAGAYSDLLIYRGKERVILKGDQQPVGLHEAQKPFKEQSFQLQDDDLVISFTDGFTDQLGGGRRRKYSIKRLLMFFDEHDKTDLVEIRERLIDEFYRWKGTEQQIDDIAILGVRI